LHEARTPIRRAADILVIGGGDLPEAREAASLGAAGWRVRTVPAPATYHACPRLILLCGWDATCAFARARPAHARTWETVVVAFCPPNPELECEVLESAVDAIITYPCPPRLLVARVQSALRRARP
jgi:hypothetical protein